MAYKEIQPAIYRVTCDGCGATVDDDKANPEGWAELHISHWGRTSEWGELHRQSRTVCSVCVHAVEGALAGREVQGKNISEGGE